MGTFADNFISKVQAYDDAENTAMRIAVQVDAIKQRKGPQLWRDVRDALVAEVDRINTAAGRTIVHLDKTANTAIRAHLTCRGSARYRTLEASYDHANDLLKWKAVGSGGFSDERSGRWNVVLQEDGNVRFDGFHVGPQAVAEDLLETLAP